MDNEASNLLRGISEKEALEVEKMCSDLLTDLKAERPRVSLAAFKRTWIHLLSGAYKDSTGQTPISAWVTQVSLSPFNEVDIIDDKGEVHFVVPPIMDDMQHNRVNHDGYESINHSTAVAFSAADGRSVAGSIDFINIMSRVMPNVKYSKELMLRWVALFDHFGVRLTADGPVEGTTKQVTFNTENEYGDDEYDPI